MQPRSFPTPAIICEQRVNAASYPSGFASDLEALLAYIIRQQTGESVSFHRQKQTLPAYQLTIDTAAAVLSLKLQLLQQTISTDAGSLLPPTEALPPPFGWAFPPS